MIMLKLLDIKLGLATRPELKDDGDFTTNLSKDCAGASEVLVLFMLGATDIAMGSTAEGTPPYLEESDDDSTWTKLTGSDQAAVFSADDDGKIYGWHIDRRNGDRKRYLRINAPHAGNGSAGVAGAGLFILGGLEKSPADATEMGLAALIAV